MTLWSSFFGLTYAVLFWLGPGLIEAGGPGLLFRLHAGWMLICAAALWALMPRDVALAAGDRQGGILAGHLAIYASPFVAGLMASRPSQAVSIAASSAAFGMSHSQTDEDGGWPAKWPIVGTGIQFNPTFNGPQPPPGPPCALAAAQWTL